MVSTRVLAVDDHIDTVEIVGAMFESLGCEVRIASTGRDALRIAAEFRPELVVMDLGLPDISGYDVARVLRRDTRTSASYLAAISGHGQLTDVAKSREAGFDVHLVKPVELARLRGLLATAQAHGRGSS